jgi:deaminated glutathione amidase
LFDRFEQGCPSPNGASRSQVTQWRFPVTGHPMTLPGDGSPNGDAGPRVGEDGPMRVSLIQAAATTDKATNLDVVRKLVGDAASQRPDLVVLPEAMMHEYGSPQINLADVAEPLDGPFVTTLADLATTYEATIVGGMFERTDGLPYNTLVAVAPDGTLAAAYRKVHLFDSFGHQESARLRAGDPTAVTVDVEDTRVGLMTCYDVRFPELARLLIDQGASLLAVPAAWVRGPLKESHWETLLRARAIENTVYVAGAAQCGPEYCGRSMLVDPFGVVTAALGEQEGVVPGDVDPGRLADVRRRNPALQHRRFQISRI